jgi:hypothetical protein
VLPQRYPPQQYGILGRPSHRDSFTRAYTRNCPGTVNLHDARHKQFLEEIGAGNEELLQKALWYENITQKAQC